MEPRITHLLARLRKRFGRAEHVAEVEEYLSAKGFDRGQIGTIVSAWLSDIGGVQRSVPVTTQGPVRIQGPHERSRFTPEAWGYLLGLRATGVLGAEELEQVIERLLMQVDGRVSLDDARTAVETGGPDGYGYFGEPKIVQ
jgi:Smg protein